MLFSKSLRTAVIGTLALAVLASCGQAKPPPDSEMTSAPTGLWTGQSDTNLSLDIQADGSIKLTANGQETFGTWKKKDDHTLTIELGGQTQDCPFTRKDLNLEIQLPGREKSDTFSQM
ncbi:MAG: hypothetical protein JNM28_01155 [Armatimonadetes bacterium]|nr:hypothetical protein [Armatimonadota bacterium]MBS1711084.1 hypothetical protein [Armatimonadota bacterium]MBX3108756.1 hypothetical protein [Fimbriimonadaceae bacterium]